MTPLEREILARANAVSKVRRKMRDYPQLNTVIEGEESSEEHVLDALDTVMEYLSDSPPPLGEFSYSEIPSYLLVDGAIAELLLSAAILLSRNYIQFSAGGITVDLPQYRVYLDLARSMKQEFRADAHKYKVSLNHQRAVDGTQGSRSSWSLLRRVPSMYSTDISAGTLPTIF